MSNITYHPDVITRGPSPLLWGPYDKANLLTPGRSIHIFTDFDDIPNVAAGAQATIYGGWKGFADTGGLAAVADVVGGALTLSSDGDNEGASIGTIHYPFQIIRDTYGDLFFEARVKTSTIADTKHGFLLGLIDASTLSATVPITAAGAVADENFVGFHRLEADGDYVNTVYKADGVTQVTVKEDAKVLVADTWVKLGMRYDAKNYRLSFYADGVLLPDYKTIPSAAGTDFPNDVRLGLVFAVLNATASTPGDSSIDWIRCAQFLD